MTIAWSCVPWASLDRDRLYELLALRARVFVVEQRCAFQDLDGADRDAWHLLGHEADRLVGYARIFPACAASTHAVIGRVVVAPESRGTGLGRALMIEAISRTRAAFGRGPIQIGAQAHLARFYGSLGFVTSGTPYDEDGIPHVPMTLAAA